MTEIKVLECYAKIWVQNRKIKTDLGLEKGRKSLESRLRM